MKHLRWLLILTFCGLGHSQTYTSVTATNIADAYRRLVAHVSVSNLRVLPIWLVAHISVSNLRVPHICQQLADVGLFSSVLWPAQSRRPHYAPPLANANELFSSIRPSSSQLDNPSVFLCALCVDPLHCLSSAPLCDLCVHLFAFDFPLCSPVTSVLILWFSNRQSAIINRKSPSLSACVGNHVPPTLFSWPSNVPQRPTTKLLSTSTRLVPSDARCVPSPRSSD